MAAERVVLQSQRISLEEETTEGTPVAETANGAMLVSEEGADIILSRESIPSNMMSGSFTKDAPEPGMWGDDIGMVLPTKMRGIGTLGANGPDWQMPAKSAFGEEYRAEAGTIDTGATAITIPVKTGGASPALKAGLLVYFPTQGEVSRIQAYSAPNMTLEIPLSAIPSEDDTFIPGVNFLLSSSPSHPIYTGYAYFGENWDFRARFTSLKTSNMALTMNVGGHCDMVFTAIAKEPLYDRTAQAITPTYDSTTPELVCLDMTGYMRAAGTITGTPTTIETVLLAPDFDVRVGDQIQVDVGSSVWETVDVTSVSGNAGGNVTIGHDALGSAGTATETAYVLRSACADVGESLSITLDNPVETEKCMFEQYGKSGIANVDRNITLESEPYFTSWEQFLMRDSAFGMGLMAILGDITNDDQNNIVAIYVSKKVNTEVSLNNNTIMSQSVNSMAAKDATLGNDYEMVMAAF